MGQKACLVESQGVYSKSESKKERFIVALLLMKSFA